MNAGFEEGNEGADGKLIRSNARRRLPGLTFIR